MQEVRVFSSNTISSPKGNHEQSQYTQKRGEIKFSHTQSQKSPIIGGVQRNGNALLGIQKDSCLLNQWRQKIPFHYHHTIISLCIRTSLIRHMSRFDQIHRSIRIKCNPSVFRMEYQKIELSFCEFMHREWSLRSFDDREW